MELLEGGDLDRVAGDRPVPPADVVGWLRQVARALDKAHARGIVHRDLKPANLFLTRREDGSPLVKILDFGVAKVASEATALTNSDSFLGTPGFMAPEQTDSRGPPVTFQADLYALGLIAFRLLTGHNYWRSGSMVQLLAQLLVEPMSPASERGSTLGHRFDAWFVRACDRDVAGRFPSATEQVEALAGALGLPEQPRLSEPVPRTVIAADGAVGSAATFNASSMDVKEVRRRIARRRWIGGSLVGTIAAIGMVAALVRGGLHGKGIVVVGPLLDTGLPTAQTSLVPPPPNSPPTASPAPTVAETAIDAGASFSASAPSPAIAPAAGPVPKHKAAALAVTPPAAAPEKSSRASDAVWRER
jgi:serine/threonine-protein kinase